MADSDRVAELKRKMQEKALQAKAQQAAEAGAVPATPATPATPVTPVTPAAPSAPQPAAATSGDGTPVAAMAAAVEPVIVEQVAIEAPAAASPNPPLAAESTAAEVAPAVLDAVVAPETVSPSDLPTLAGLPAAVATPPSNGDLPDEVYATRHLTPEELADRQMTRRELLTYAWAGALGLVVLGTAFATFEFMYPRFKVGEFGGKFYLGPMATMPPTDAPPQPNTAGKFWLVNTTGEGVKALYMVCTHLGCLYKWESSTVRFECPCHGSKFSREGFYIEGPAPRSLDRFEVSEEGGLVVVDTGAKITGNPSSASPARAVPA